MTNTTHPHRFAGTAIAAVLALGSTPLWAQESAPIGEPPAAIAAPAPPPTIVLPPVTAVPVAPVSAAPVSEAVVAAPVVARPIPRAAAPVARPAVTRAAAAPVAQEQQIVPTPVEAPAAGIASDETIAIEQTPMDQQLAEETAVAATADDSSSNILPLAGLLAALGLGGIGLYAARRRRRQPDEIEPAIVAYEPAPTIVPRPVQSMPSPTFVAPAMSLRPVVSQNGQGSARPAWQEPRRAAAAPASSQASQLNREALLKRMVAATPDANNPFTSAKARRRRARLMLQSMDNQRWDDTQLAPGFDWREQARGARAHEAVPA